MRILLVEDEPAAASGIMEDIANRVPGIEFIQADSRDAAVDLLEAQEFDLLICDLLIPPQSGGLDQDIDHGLFVYEHARAESPGMPALFLTGAGSYQDVREALPARGRADLFGEGDPTNMVDLFFKDERDAYVARIEMLAGRLAELESSVVIDVISAGQPMLESELRTLKIFARRLNASRMQVDELSGLSGSRALRLQLFDSADAHVAWVFAKVGIASRIQNEKERTLAIHPRLTVGTYAPLLWEVDAGAGKRAALFFGNINQDDYPYTVFEWLQLETDQSGFVGRIRELLGNMEAAKTSEVITIQELRRLYITDEQLETYLPRLGASLCTDVEAKTIDAGQTMQHGDLHCCNIMVTTDGQPILIDFERSGFLPMGLDPVVLEMSLLFHDKSPFRADSWPSQEQCSQWHDIEIYAREAPLSDFVRAARAWALDAAQTEQSFLALVYCHALRQLKYGDTNKERAIAIAQAAANRLVAT